ncbi:hypothetical protein BCV69DRAFT_285807 [Microstroma glucosiphilum]|uniref:Uncharacterized protein n=1 Tax=Pseudomicrostroma glucosiphilum TaxID=1684307 RepID=A0A316TZJ7_9BASI|nr:hypothetical protein BCV69DRAFT_285807 [Pseudomicrostroma glucosiphilum]PWN17693.1 hypothetical protein BCV69DRAFT_285807 [Pseudomicrostroma glucosiphilum]
MDGLYQAMQAQQDFARGQITSAGLDSLAHRQIGLVEVLLAHSWTATTHEQALSSTPGRQLHLLPATFLQSDHDCPEWLCIAQHQGQLRSQ